MRSLPAGARWVFGTGFLLIAAGLVRFGWPLGTVGLVLVATAALWAELGTGARLRGMRQWLQDREGPVTLPGADAWEALESELRYHLKHRNRRIRELRGRLEKLEDLARDLPVGVALLDSEGRLQEANDKAYHLLAVDPERGTGQKLQGWLREPDLQALFTASGADIRQATAPYRPDPSRTLAFTCTRKEGGTLLLVVEEITERIRLQKMREDFVANASHELKSPLTSLRGFAETLLSEPDLPEEQRQEFLRIMADQIQRMQSLVDDLLTLSRLEADTADVPETPVPLGHLLGALADDHRILAEQRGIALSIPPSEEAEGTRVFGDADSLGRALGNLVDNAIKYTPEGGAVAVSLEPRPGEQEVAIHVADTGIGIPEHHLPRLTERFYRVDKGRSRELGGTGLGLSIAKHILHRHGGRLEATSRVGEGSTFTAVLPDRLGVSTAIRSRSYRLSQS